MEERRMRKVASKKNCEQGSSKWLEAMTRVNGGNCAFTERQIFRRTVHVFITFLAKFNL